MTAHNRKRRRKRPYRSPPGSPPGSLPARADEPPPRLTLVTYGPDRLQERALTHPGQLADARAEGEIAWLNVDGLGHTVTVAAVGEALGIHALSLEDAVGTHQRPKVEDYGSYLFVVVRMPRSTGPFETEQVSLCLGRDFVVTFQEHDRPGDTFEPVRQRLRQSVGRFRSLGPDYLGYALIDTVIDAYFPLLEDLGDRLESLEQQVLDRPDTDAIRRVHAIKRDLASIRRVTWPLRDAMNILVRDPTPLIGPEAKIYLRDCYDHTVQIIDLVESYREVSSGLMDLHLSGVSNRMNQVVKVLTVISTIFIPLTFIAGVYGMNFDPGTSPWNMPELRWRYGYPASLLLMLAVAMGMLWMFYRWGWIGTAERPAQEREQGQPGPLSEPPRNGK